MGVSRCRCMHRCRLGCNDWCGAKVKRYFHDRLASGTSSRLASRRPRHKQFSRALCTSNSQLHKVPLTQVVKLRQSAATLRRRDNHDAERLGTVTQSRRGASWHTPATILTCVRPTGKQVTVQNACIAQDHARNIILYYIIACILPRY